MFYPCVVKDKEGNVKKEYSTKQLTRRHWKKFQITLPLNAGTSKKIKASQHPYDFRAENDSNFYLP